MIEIDCIPRVTLRNLKGIISEGFQTDKQQALRFRLGGLRYVVEFIPCEYELLFKWTDEDGCERKQKVYLYGSESNLLKETYVWYFVCPATGRHCRKLYTDGRRLVSRYAFPHTYSDRNLSHKTRRLRRLLETMETEEELHEFLDGICNV